MPLIEQIVAELSKAPRPVLCLDTCDFLHLIQNIAEDDFHFSAATRLVAAARSKPNSVLQVISFLVPIEFEQNVDRVEREIRVEIDKFAARIERIHRAGSAIGKPMTNSADEFRSAVFPEALRQFALKVLGTCSIIERDEECIGRAVERVISKRRPSQDRGLSDSILLEHYLKLALSVKSAGISVPFFFASSNGKEFWKDKKDPKAHPDLLEDYTNAGVEFVGSWDAACGRLGI